MNNNEIDKELKVILDDFTGMLLSGLEENNIIKKIKNPDPSDPNPAYEVVLEEIPEEVDESDSGSLSDLTSKENTAIQEFLDFRDAILSVSNSLNFMRGDRISNIVNNLINSGALSMSEQYVSLLKKLFDDGHNLLGDDNIKIGAIKIIDENKIRIAKHIGELLEFYSFEIAKKYFKEHQFKREVNVSDSPNRRANRIDIIGYANQEDNVDVLIEVKFRRKNIGITKDLMYQAIEILRKYNNQNGKENIILLNVFTYETGNFDRIKYAFEKNLEEIFPEYVGHVFFIPVSIRAIHQLSAEFEEVISQLSRIDKNIKIELKDAPKIIAENEVYKIKGKFLGSPIGTFSVWVKVPPVSSFYKEPMNNKYIIGHDTNKGYTVKTINKYVNAFGLCLHPNIFNSERKGPPTAVQWRLWITNENGEQDNITTPNLTDENYNWNHFLIRWNHKKPILELFLNGKLIESKSNYHKFWPNNIDEHAMLGNWVYNHKVHWLDMALFRVIIAENFLSDLWLNNELKNKPN